MGAFSWPVSDIPVVFLYGWLAGCCLIACWSDIWPDAGYQRTHRLPTCSSMLPPLRLLSPQGRWGSMSALADLDALLASLDRRGVRELALAEVLCLLACGLACWLAALCAGMLPCLLLWVALLGACRRSMEHHTHCLTLRVPYFTHWACRAGH